MTAPPYPAPASCTMYLLRHGATDYNLKRPAVLQGRGVDLGLNSTGQAQAHAAATALARVSLSAVYASPLKRAVETAQAVAKLHSLGIQFVPNLVEVDVGLWENRSWTQIADEYPEAYQKFQTDPGENPYLGGENLLQVRDRVHPEFVRIAASHPNQTIAIVGHNVVNRAFLAGILGLPMARARLLMQENGCLNTLHFSDGQFTLRTLNAVSHLESKAVAH